ncbi:MAG: hypothetical protein K2M55_08370 [Muribaculaceae bacterium]|nr:hypothetical protein [Muribaculaceae bacterium]
MPEDINLDKFRAAWQRTNVSSETLSHDPLTMTQKVVTGRAHSSLQRLARRVRISSYVAMCMPVFAPLLVTVLDLPYWIAAVYAFFGIVLSAVNLVFARNIEAVRLAQLPVVTALSVVQNIRRRMICQRATSFVIAITIIVLIVSTSMHLDPSLSGWEFAFGIVLGLLVAMKKFHRDWRLISDTENDLRYILSPKQQDVE